VGLDDKRGVYEGVLIEGRYRIISPIARGGMGDVWLAEQTQIERQVAIKILALGTSVPDTPEFRARFVQEAKLAAKLEHPNVIRIYDFGFFGDAALPFIAMEYLDGVSFKDYIQRSDPNDNLGALLLFQAALEALGYAHDRGIVHKDIKPDNLFVRHPWTSHEQMTLLDFGVSRALDFSPTEMLTRAGDIVGTPEYMAPEYIVSQVVSPAFDVYAMGLLLYEIFTKRTAVVGKTSFECMTRHVRGELGLELDAIPKEYVDIINRATALEPKDRYTTALEFAAELGALLNDRVSRDRKRVQSSQFLRIPSQVTRATLATRSSSPPSTSVLWGDSDSEVSVKPPARISTRVETRSAPQAETRPQPFVRDEFSGLFRRATQMVLERRYDEALEAFIECDRIRPEDRRVRHNITTIQRRLQLSSPTHQPELHGAADHNEVE